MKKSIYILFIVLFSFSCGKEDGLIPYDCASYKMQANIPDFSSDRTQYKFASINPSNGDELVVYVKPASGANASVVKFNIATGEHWVLKEDVYVVGKIAYGSSGWITFVHPLINQFIVMKDDGTNEFAITNGGFVTSPFIDARDCVYWLSASDYFDTKRYLFRMNIFDTIIDTLFVPSDNLNYVYTVSNTDILAAVFVQDHSYNLCEVKLDGVKNFQHRFSAYNVESLSYSPDRTKLYYVANGEVYVFDLYQKTNAKLRDLCGSKRYINVSVFPDNKHLLLERKDFYFNGGDAASVSLYKFNLETLEETLIKFPEI